MANTVIQLKKSGTPSAIPVDLANGELAINYADGKIFYKSTLGTIQEISGGGTSFGTVNANGTLIVADTTGDILTLIAGGGINIVGDSINDTITISSVADVTLPYNTANAAFDKANAVSIVASAAFDKANTGGGASTTNVYSQSFVANGAQTVFTIDNVVPDQNNIIVSVDGLLQIPGMHYTLSGSDVVFTSQPIDKSNIEVRTTITTSTFFSDFQNYANAVGLAANTIAIAAFDKANSTSYTSNVVISVTDNTNAALRITQTGSGDALIIEDAANPDNTPFIVNSNGDVGISNTSPSSKLTVGGTIESTVGGIKFPDGSTQTTAASAGISTGKAIAMAIVFG